MHEQFTPGLIDSRDPKRAAELLAAALERQGDVLRAAWIDLHRGDLASALGLLAGALPQFSADTGWDGSETGQEWLDRSSGGQAAGRPAPWTGLDQCPDRLPGFPAGDDAEVAGLVEAVRGLPRVRADLVTEAGVQSALAYERTSEPRFLARHAASLLGTLRTERAEARLSRSTADGEAR